MENRIDQIGSTSPPQATSWESKGRARSSLHNATHNRRIDRVFTGVAIVGLVPFVMISTATFVPPAAATGCSGVSSSGVSPACSGGQSPCSWSFP